MRAASTTTASTQFGIGDFSNAYDYLSVLEANYLIGPGHSAVAARRSTGATGCSCAGWATTSPAPSRWRPISPGSWCRPTSTGARNVEAATGEDFPTLVTEWQLANYLDDLPRLHAGRRPPQLHQLAFRAIWASFNSQNPAGFHEPYPLDPDVTTGGYETPAACSPARASTC